jgi:hypothetical protein
MRCPSGLAVPETTAAVLAPLARPVSAAQCSMLPACLPGIPSRSARRSHSCGMAVPGRLPPAQITRICTVAGPPAFAHSAAPNGGSCAQAANQRWSRSVIRPSARMAPDRRIGAVSQAIEHDVRLRTDSPDLGHLCLRYPEDRVAACSLTRPYELAIQFRGSSAMTSAGILVSYRQRRASIACEVYRPRTTGSVICYPCVPFPRRGKWWLG